MSLIQSAKLNDIDPWHYLRDVMERLPTNEEDPPRQVSQAWTHKP
ncbi:mobile element protein [Caldimonas brevitalea]|uniref:Mobile element protein n=1 Tax=Caldimonas brevitalea TaxID=413882 RepID=A0A0G3BPA7_9BURK|nr:mobile element protein [Caldimonas brevitalea]